MGLEVEQFLARAFSFITSLERVILEKFLGKSYIVIYAPEEIVDLCEKFYGDIGLRRRCHS